MKGRRPYQPSLRVSRRAGCHESGLSGSREAERSKSHWLNPVLLSHGGRPGLESGRPRTTRAIRSRDRRSGWVKPPSSQRWWKEQMLHESRSWGPGQSAMRYRGRGSQDSCPTSGLVQREKTGELSCGNVRYRADDNARRSGETSPTVKSSTGNRPSRAFFAVRQETVPNREWTG